MLAFSIENQLLTRNDSTQVVSNSSNYLYAYFNFSSDWNSVTTKLAVISNGTTNTTSPIVNNTCLIPAQYIKPDNITISVYGESSSKKITTNSVNIPIIDFPFDITI